MCEIKDNPIIFLSLLHLSQQLRHKDIFKEVILTTQQVHSKYSTLVVKLFSF